MITSDTLVHEELQLQWHKVIPELLHLSHGAHDTGLVTGHLFWSDLALLYLDSWSSPHTIWFIDLLRSLPMWIALWSRGPVTLHINWFNISVKTSHQQRNCTWKTSIGIQNFITEDGLMSLTYSQPLERLAMKYQIICFKVFFLHLRDCLAWCKAKLKVGHKAFGGIDTC